MPGNEPLLVRVPLSAHPDIDVARGVAEHYDLDRVVVWFVTNDGRDGYVSYGRDRALCNDTRRLADRMYDAAREYLTAESHGKED